MIHSSPNHISAKELFKWINDESDKPFLVDVREKNELLISPFPYPTMHLPLSEVDIWKESVVDRLPSQTPVVAICHAGVRSLNFAIWLLDQGFSSEVWSLDGGIEAWSLEVDPSVPRY